MILTEDNEDENGLVILVLLGHLDKITQKKVFEEIERIKEGINQEEAIEIKEKTLACHSTFKKICYVIDLVTKQIKINKTLIKNNLGSEDIRGIFFMNSTK